MADYSWNRLSFCKEKVRVGIRALFQPCDPTPLALFRVAFGFLMMLDIPQERGLEDADIRFGDVNFCFFPLFSWVTPVPVQYAVLLYSAMWIGALGICLGYKFKLACPLFLGPYLYFLLLDKSRWNNHSYLFALFTLLLWVSGAGEGLSLDSWIKTKPNPVRVPRWNYSLLKFQIFVLYFFAGVKKLDSDWVLGYSMKNLAKHWIFSPVKTLIEPNVIEFYMVHMGGLLYDLLVGFMLNFEFSKKFGVLISVMFHGMNSQIFDIGMFPYVCLASLILFCKPEQFPCSYFCNKNKTIAKEKERKKCTKKHKTFSPIFTTRREKWTFGLCSFYVVLQIFMPFSHFITRGYNNWTPGLYGYSWDMMVNSWETLHQKITVKNKVTGQEKYLDPDIWVANDRWSSHADMAVQYAQCISRNLKRFNITEIEVYFDIWKSLNGRFQQRIYDPRVDILTAPWSPFAPVPWILPLLKEYSHYRSSYFDSISSTVANWTTSSDVIFVADFPGLYLENFLPVELSNISLTLINGEVIVEQDGRNMTLSINGGHVTHPIQGGRFHKVHSVAYYPSCYMYTYRNLTFEGVLQRQESESGGESGNFLQGVGKDLKEFFWEKVEVFSRCVYLVANSYLNLVFDVPMIVRRSVG